MLFEAALARDQQICVHFARPISTRCVHDKAFKAFARVAQMRLGMVNIHATRADISV